MTKEDLLKIKRVHLGCGKKRFRGYLDIDIEPIYNPDLVADFRDLHFENLETIRAYHLLEHFTREEGNKVLKLWSSWLKKGGILIVETPDFEGICELFFKEQHRRDWLVHHAYGSQDFNWALHKDGWYEDKFIRLFPEFGLQVDRVEKYRCAGRKLPNIKVVAHKI